MKSKRQRGLSPALALLWLAAVFVTLSFAARVARGALAYRELERDNASLAGTYAPEDRKPATAAELTAEATEGDRLRAAYPLTVDHAGLKAANQDYAAWLYFENAGISLPVVRDSGAGEYLHRSFAGKGSFAGTVFADGEAPEDTVCEFLFGHNMRDGSMFGGLKRVDYTRRNVFYLDSPDGLTAYEVFAVARVDRDDALYTVPAGDDAYTDYVRKIGAATGRDYTSEAWFLEGARLAALSTCDGKQGTRKRMIVFGHEVN